MPDMNEPLQFDSLSLTSIDSRNCSADAAQKKAIIGLIKNLRSSPRQTCNFSQNIALMTDRFNPAADEFFKVECNDISRGGISFYLKRLPGCDHFAVALGKKPNVVILIARVVSSKEVLHNGQEMHLVGCQFVNRLRD
jgi:hypothetical protein